jgi:hypothetical protein
MHGRADLPGAQLGGGISNHNIEDRQDSRSGRELPPMPICK